MTAIIYLTFGEQKRKATRERITLFSQGEEVLRLGLRGQGFLDRIYLRHWIKKLKKEGIKRLICPNNSFTAGVCLPFFGEDNLCFHLAPAILKALLQRSPQLVTYLINDRAEPWCIALCDVACQYGGGLGLALGADTKILAEQILALYGLSVDTKEKAAVPYLYIRKEKNGTGFGFCPLALAEDCIQNRSLRPSFHLAEVAELGDTDRNGLLCYLLEKNKSLGEKIKVQILPK